jgi:hypothetical protein
MEEKEKPPDEFFKCVKVPLKHVIKHPDINIPKIQDTAIMANKIVIHTLQFMKLYLLNYYNKHNKLPVIDKTFINTCIKVQCEENKGGRPASNKVQKLKDELNAFYNKEYKPLLQNETLSYKHMNTILDYLTIDILTMYENNIKLHYVEYLERYVNVFWKKKFLIEKIRKLNTTKKEKDKRVNGLCNQLRKIKNDLLNVENNEYKSKSFYHSWIENNKKVLLANKKEFKKNNLYYDIQCSPQDYLPSMIFIMKEVDKEGFSINNVFPMRSEIIPKHIRLDTTTLVHLLMTKKQGKKSDYLFKGNLKRFEDKIWKFFFRTERQCFKKKWYSFHHMIETDGVSCSILLMRKDKVGKRVQQKKGGNKEQYIDELKNKDYKELKNKKIVAIDPNMSDLLYCVDGDNKERNFFRYTQNQRRKETKHKKYRNIILQLKNKKVIELETELSKYNRKTLDYNEFKKYIKKKNKINMKLFKFYENYIFRKLKLNSYINRLKSEQQLINRFKKIFGSPKDTIVCIGDWEQRKHRKFKEPTKGIGFRNMFRKSSFQVYLVDEFRTSCRCSNCEGGECSKFREIRNPKPAKNNSILSHGLLLCKKDCGLWNRDENSARNIYKIANNAINKKERPTYLSRSKVISGTSSVGKLQCHSTSLVEATQSKFTCPETGKLC